MSEITDRIRAYNSSKITDDELVRILLDFPYRRRDRPRHGPSARAPESETGEDTDGTWAELDLTASTGFLPEELFMRVVNELCVRDPEWLIEESRPDELSLGNLFEPEEEGQPPDRRTYWITPLLQVGEILPGLAHCSTSATTADEAVALILHGRTAVLPPQAWHTARAVLEALGGGDVWEARLRHAYWPWCPPGELLT